MLKILTLLFFSLTSCVFAPFSGDAKCIDCEAAGCSECSTHAKCGVLKGEGSIIPPPIEALLEE